MFEGWVYPERTCKTRGDPKISPDLAPHKVDTAASYSDPNDVKGNEYGQGESPDGV